VIAWGSNAPNCAVNGLAALLRRDEWHGHPDGERICQLLRPQLDNPDDTVRMLASMALPLLVKPEDLTGALCDRLLHEGNGSVLEVLVGILANHVATDPGGIDVCLGRLAIEPAWSMLAANPEDRSIPPNQRRSEIGDLLVQVLLYLGLARATPFASGLLTAWQMDPQKFPATIGRLVAWSRPYLNPPGETGTVPQAGAFELLTRLTDTCVSVTSSAQETLASGATLADDQREDLQSAAWIAHCVAREIYHASGAFQTQQEKSQPDERVVSPQFSSLSFPLIEKLATVPAAGIAHHLVQTLVFLSHREPRRAFLVVAKIATPGSGYENESLGETEVLDLVDLYLAERRDVILNDPDCLSGLRQILETFVAVGSDRAIRRVQDLAELFT
jgi:hypothetical protein